MKTTILIVMTSFICLAAITLDEPVPRKVAESDNNQDVQAQTSLSSSFDIMMQVISHKRCVNCHPSGDRPRQGEDSHIHNFNVQRGEHGHGMATHKCGSCHQSENNLYSGVPGAPHWHLAPKSMAWEGLSRTEIARAILDKSKNGGRSLEEIGKHLTEDPLVMWAFDPGINNEGEAREKPPVAKEDFIKAVKQWISEGAPIPNE